MKFIITQKSILSLEFIQNVKNSHGKVKSQPKTTDSNAALKHLKKTIESLFNK